MDPNQQQYQPSYPTSDQPPIQFSPQSGGYAPMQNGSLPITQQAQGYPPLPGQMTQPGIKTGNVQSQAPAPIAPKSNPNSTQNTLQIAEIRDGVVIMNDGSFRSVIMTKSINFDLMSQGEREAVEFSYQGFLNSLYFPIQIYIRSQKVDIRPYLEKLDKVRSEHDNMLLALLMEDYINFMADIAQQTNIMNKRFYVVIPYYSELNIQKGVSAGKSFIRNIIGSKEKQVTINEPELEKAKTELRNRVQAVLSGLLQTGVQGLPLDTQELIELYYDAYNPETASRQQLKNFDDLSAPIITKGTGVAPTPQLDRQSL